MFRTRVMSPGYLGVGVAIATALATSLVSPPARAQDLNLQTQLNIFSPPVTFVPLDSAGKQSALSAVKSCPKPGVMKLDAQKSDLMDFLKENPDLTVDDLTAQSARFQERYNGFLQKHPKANARRNAKALQPVPIDFNCLVQQPKFKTTFPFNPTYETNVLKKGDGSSVGESAGFGGNVLFTTGGFRRFDLIAMGAGETSVRYASPFFSSSFDSISSQLFYQAFVHADGYLKDGKRVDVESHMGGDLISGLITFDTVSFGVQNQTAFTPTLHKEKSDLFTPQVTIARQNINLDDPADIVKCNDQAQGFCHYANLSLTIGQTFSDVFSQQNFNIAGSAALGWRIDPELSLTLNATATGKHYENLVGGREDLLLQAGPALTYSHKISDMNVTLQLPVTYFKNYSTVAAASWSGFIIQPTLSIAFTTDAPPAPPK